MSEVQGLILNLIPHLANSKLPQAFDSFLCSKLDLVRKKTKEREG
ncbi:hypothetical protein COLO4_08883 [Corchorus olitorius]|uniref:Uncharacterized protein n=1 Tax=Corchorus olitorius TaxID=93759 RepID=A0A1R3KED1_9ROSI|nr:hypothetical protein COLO4_08883 [Corchorus olitorius]